MENTEFSIAELKAQAAMAAAEAAEARAAALQAQLDAALAKEGSNQDNRPLANEEKPISEKPLNEVQDDSVKNTGTELSNFAKSIATSYGFSGQTLTLGTLLEDNLPQPEVTIKLPLATLNRHGLVAGATGTGKTRTLQLMAEGLSDAGVSVFLTDVKGDLTGISEPGVANEKLLERTKVNGQPWQADSHPLELANLAGSGAGFTIRTTISDIGPLLLARILELNETQESALQLVFHWADSQGIALVDLTDIRAVFNYLTSEEGRDELKIIGGISPASAGVILRQIAALESQGGDQFFGEPAFDPTDLLRTDSSGRGIITCLELPELAQRPTLLSTFIMWLLADLFASLPEVGDLDKPKLVFFFDEAHLLFNNATPAFLQAVVNTVRLIRSKGVGVVFVTQTPKDVPADVLAQLGARVQHALRAFTPQDAKALKATAQTFPSTELDLESLLTTLGTGEAIVTVLDSKGRPTPVAPTRLWAPSGQMGIASDATLSNVVKNSAIGTKYANKVDPYSAQEMLAERMANAEKEKDNAIERELQAKIQLEREKAEIKRQAKEEEQARRAAEREATRQQQRTERRTDSVINTLLTTATRTVGQKILRSIFGNIGRR